MIKPLHDKVLLEQIEPDTPKSGIILAEGATQSLREPIAYVLAVGTQEGIKVEIGDKVYFDPAGLFQLTVSGKNHLLISYRSIVAVLGKREDKKKIIEGA